MSKKEVELYGSGDSVRTPDWCFNWLSSRFNFVLDAAASESNAKCTKYFTEENDALSKDWKLAANGDWIFCNPPYSDIAPWVKHACHYWLQHKQPTVMLLPVRTDLPWFHEYVLPHARIEWYQGRVWPGMYERNMNVIFGRYEASAYTSLPTSILRKEWSK